MVQDTNMVNSFIKYQSNSSLIIIHLGYVYLAESRHVSLFCRPATLLALLLLFLLLLLLLFGHLSRLFCLFLLQICLIWNSIRLICRWIELRLRPGNELLQHGEDLNNLEPETEERVQDDGCLHETDDVPTELILNFVRVGVLGKCWQRQVNQKKHPLVDHLHVVFSVSYEGLLTPHVGCEGKLLERREGDLEERIVTYKDYDE